MKRILRLAVLLLLSTIIHHPSTLHAQGSLTPPGPPAPTMKTLQQVEPRTAINNATAVTISASGSYYLTTNINVTGGDAITIGADNVTLDLNGFTVSSTAASATGCGILLSGGRAHIHILNGFIQGGVIYSGGVYSGSGFAYGIAGSVVAPVNTRVSGVSVSGCAIDGIHLGLDAPTTLGGSSTVVESCTVWTVGGSGIVAVAVSDSTASQCGLAAIIAHTASHCRGDCTGSDFGVYSNTADNCIGTSATGDGLNAYTANNCYGASTSGASSGNGLAAYAATGCSGSGRSGKGLYAFTANNCYGASSNGTGLYAANTAMGCVGQSSSGDGLYATTAHNCDGRTSGGIGLHVFATASNCYGQSSADTGLQAISASNCYGNGGKRGLLTFYVASNCYGESPGGIGVDTRIAMGCYGFSNTGTGLFAYIANSCVGSGTTPIVYTYHYNMPP